MKSFQAKQLSVVSYFIDTLKLTISVKNKEEYRVYKCVRCVHTQRKVTHGMVNYLTQCIQLYICYTILCSGYYTVKVQTMRIKNG